MSDAVELRIAIETVPTNRGEHVAIKNNAGAVLWDNGTSRPPNLEVRVGDELTVIASIRRPIRRGLASRTWNGVWRLVAESGAIASLHLGPEGLEGPLRRLEITVTGARTLSDAE